MLTRWAQDHGLKWTLEKVLDDTGLTAIRTSDIAGGAPYWKNHLDGERPRLKWRQRGQKEESGRGLEGEG